MAQGPTQRLPWGFVHGGESAAAGAQELIGPAASANATIVSLGRESVKQKARRCSQAMVRGEDDFLLGEAKLTLGDDTLEAKPGTWDHMAKAGATAFSRRGPWRARFGPARRGVRPRLCWSVQVCLAPRRV
jgi:hypothetical protein